VCPTRMTQRAQMITELLKECHAPFSKKKNLCQSVSSVQSVVAPRSGKHCARACDRPWSEPELLA
jgi:hypothetical protein